MSYLPAPSKLSSIWICVSAVSRLTLAFSFHMFMLNIELVFISMNFNPKFFANPLSAYRCL